jgi:hypothetical protein
MTQVLSDLEFILQSVVRILLARADTGSTSNLVLQLALTELVKQVMRDLVQDTEKNPLEGHLLQKAIQTTVQLIEKETRTAALQYDLSPYFTRIYRSERWVAKEMTELSLRLRQSRNEFLRSPRSVIDVPVPFRVSELGTVSTLEGVMVHPLTPCQLDLEKIRQEYIVFGNGFPLEVEMNEITFVIEADGSVITFVEGFPESVIEQVKSSLEQFVCDLYAPTVT